MCIRHNLNHTGNDLQHIDDSQGAVSLHSDFIYDLLTCIHRADINIYFATCLHTEHADFWALKGNTIQMGTSYFSDA